MPTEVQHGTGSIIYWHPQGYKSSSKNAALDAVEKCSLFPRTVTVEGVGDFVT